MEGQQPLKINIDLDVLHSERILSQRLSQYIDLFENVLSVVQQKDTEIKQLKEQLEKLKNDKKT